MTTKLDLKTLGITNNFLTNLTSVAIELLFANFVVKFDGVWTKKPKVVSLFKLANYIKVYL